MARESPGDVDLVKIHQLMDVRAILGIDARMQS